MVCTASVGCILYWNHQTTWNHSKYTFLCLFFSVCFHVVKGIQLEPAYIVLFKWPYDKSQLVPPSFLSNDGTFLRRRLSYWTALISRYNLIHSSLKLQSGGKKIPDTIRVYISHKIIKVNVFDEGLFEVVETKEGQWIKKRKFRNLFLTLYRLFFQSL